MDHEKAGKDIAWDFLEGEHAKVIHTLLTSAPLDAAALMGWALEECKYKKYRRRLIKSMVAAAEGARAVPRTDDWCDGFRELAEFFLWRCDHVDTGMAGAIEDLVRRPPHEIAQVVFWIARDTADRPTFSRPFLDRLERALRECDEMGDNAEHDDDDPHVIDWIEGLLKVPDVADGADGRRPRPLPWRQPGRVLAANWIVQRLADPACAGAREIVEQLWLRHNPPPPREEAPEPEES